MSLCTEQKRLPHDVGEGGESCGCAEREEEGFGTLKRLSDRLGLSWGLGLGIGVGSGLGVGARIRVKGLASGSVLIVGIRVVRRDRTRARANG